MSDRYYYDESGGRRTLHRDMLQIQREQRKAEARSNRDAARDKVQKAKDDLFNGNKRQITESTTKNLPTAGYGGDDAKTYKKDQKRPNTGNPTGGGGGDYNDTELRNMIQALEDRLDEASIDAECGEGEVTVTLNI
jgi:hypothetical protein